MFDILVITHSYVFRRALSISIFKQTLDLLTGLGCALLTYTDCECIFYFIAICGDMNLFLWVGNMVREHADSPATAQNVLQNSVNICLKNASASFIREIMSSEFVPNIIALENVVSSDYCSATKLEILLGTMKQLGLPLYYDNAVKKACQCLNEACLKILLDAGASVSSDQAIFGIHVIASNGKCEALQMLLKYGVDPNCCYDGASLLVNAIKSGNDGLVDVLLNSGASIGETEVGVINMFVSQCRLTWHLIEIIL